MIQANTHFVGDSFKLGYRHQTYWGRSMAIAFFCAEVGSGTFLVSMYYDYLVGMIVGLVLAGILKPYYHLAHMGVPQKSWRAFARFDRSWVSRGGTGVVCLVGFGVLYVLNRSIGLGLPPQIATAIKALAIVGGLVVICYQGLAMAASESLTLWATPFVPLASICYAATAGVLTTLTLASATGAIDAAQQVDLVKLAAILIVLDFVVVMALLFNVRSKSQGGAFSVQLLSKGVLAGRFRNLVILLGFVVPLVLLIIAGVVASAQLLFVALAWIAMLIGFFTFRLLMFRAAVFEPITHNLAGSIGLPR
jgi:formate-dependent nitrite reductase membrane component NrfD